MSVIMMKTPCLTPVEAVDSVLRRYRLEGGRSHQSTVTDVEHAAQAAMLARQANLPAAVVAACLLHDYGRLLGASDADHAEVGADALGAFFGPAVTEPIRLHTRAWSYLAATEPDFVLAHPPVDADPAATRAPMSGAEVRAFLDEAWSGEAASVRRIDEASRLPGIDSPPLEHHRSLLVQLALRQQLGG